MWQPYWVKKSSPPRDLHGSLLTAHAPSLHAGREAGTPAVPESWKCGFLSGHLGSGPASVMNIGEI